ncbi:MAG TPA: GNAT family N-acetyltransferase [Ktedonobacteraceae bacterium]
MESMVAEMQIRQARAEDREAVLAFCEHTWEWGDYIASRWDEWLNDPAGQLLVALVASQPVGIVHMLMLNATDAWQEGMRVDPAYRQQGIGHQLSFEAGAEAIRRGASIVRLLTNATNSASIHMVEQSHFHRIGIFAPHSARALTEPPRRLYGLEEPVLAAPEDLAEIIDYLNISNLFPSVGGLYYAGFVGYRISDTLLQEKIQAEQIYLLRRWERLDGLAIAETRAGRQDKHLFIGYIDGTTESISLLAYALRRRLPALGLDSVRANVPDLMMVREAFSGAEYTASDNTFYTYERSLL